METEVESRLVGAIPAMSATLASSDDENVLTPKHKKTTRKKKTIVSDDEEEMTVDKSPAKSQEKSESENDEDEVKPTKRRSRLLMANSSSDEESDKISESTKPKKDFGLRILEKKSFDLLKKKNKVALMESSDEELEYNKAESGEAPDQQQQKILDSLRAQFGNESSDEEERENDGRHSSLSNKSNRSEEGKKTKKKATAPKRKSAVACRAAMDKERQKMISENQRMVRESAASLPYHKPKQRTLKEFLSARPRASLELKGVKHSNVDITVIGKELEETEKLADEFYKPESEEEEERYTPPPPQLPPALAEEADEEITGIPFESSSVAETDESSLQQIGVESAKKTLDFDELTIKLDELNGAETLKKPFESSGAVPVDEEPSVAVVHDSESGELSEIEPSNDEISVKHSVVDPLLIKEAITAEIVRDACLTLSDAAPETVFAVPAPLKENKTDIPDSVEDSLEEEMHLYLEDTDEILEEKPATEESKQETTFDLQKMYDTNFSSDEEEKKEKSPEKAKKSPLKATTRSQLLERLKNSKPVRLSGGPSEIIDFTDGEEAKSIGVHDLMERFIRNATAGKKKSLDPKQDGFLNLMKAGEKVDEVFDLNAKPGSKMSQLKSELQESIAKQRVEDFKQRQNEYKMYEDETDELLGNDFGEDEKEEKDFDEFDPHLANETESEPEIDEEEEEYVKPEKPRVKSAFVDEEAEEDEVDDAPEGEDEAKEDCDGDDENENNDDEEMDCDDEESEDSDDLKMSTPGVKKQFSRIIRVEDSDDENETSKIESGDIKLDDSKLDDNEKVQDISFTSNLNISTNLSNSILDSPQIGTDTSKKSNMMGDLYDPTQPAGRKGAVSSGITQMFEDARENKQSEKVQPDQSQDLNSSAVKSPANLDKLHFDNDSQSENLADLCSGQFLTVPETQQNTRKDSSAPIGMLDLVSDGASLSINVADLCSGQFVTQAKDVGIKALVGSAVEETQDLEALCSGQFVTQDDQKGIPTDFDKLVGNDVKKSQTQDLAALCSGNFDTQIANEETEVDGPENEIRSPVHEKNGAKLAISSDDEDLEPKEKGLSVEKKKRKKKKRKLDFSDDEEEEELEEEEVAESEAEEAGDYSLVDYDSEENEVVMQPGPKKSKASKFFEAEAELSGSDWESADEDERDLDEFEEELGDREQIDEDNLKEQLGQIHARRLLDDDKRDIRLFQEAFLEDGDLHAEGGGRQRLFRWKNTDDGDWQGGCNPNLSGDEGLEEDEEDDATWRTLRLERENWLKENSAQEMTLEANDENSHLLTYGKNLLAKINGAKLKAQPEPKDAEKKRIQPLLVKSPGKAILQRLQGKSGSFFSRTKISLTKVVQITGSDNDGIVSNTSKGNFVFSTISPSSLKGPAEELADRSFEEASPQPAKTKKRQAPSNPSTNPRAKKHKVSNSIFKLL